MENMTCQAPYRLIQTINEVKQNTKPLKHLISQYITRVSFTHRVHQPSDKGDVYNGYRDNGGDGSNSM
ncbi:Hypothetical predicted protein [Octopus vulgaris]|uniref:Uncharacterized protein n=1 Tax=Octopus vulgaris TaxID=6645 RepID=A0AA36B3D0_OCTVU|nr:Hypothetical predicted protein [Octopus vulgaris]